MKITESGVLRRFFTQAFLFYLSPFLITPHHGKVDLDDRPRGVGVFDNRESGVGKLGKAQRLRLRECPITKRTGI